MWCNTPSQESTVQVMWPYSKEGKKIRSFGSEGSSTGQFQYPRGAAITSDNHILIADRCNERIQMFTREGSFVKSVGQKGQEPLKFYYPSGIAVHPSGIVFVAESLNNRIQVPQQKTGSFPRVCRFAQAYKPCTLLHTSWETLVHCLEMNPSFQTWKLFVHGQFTRKCTTWKPTMFLLCTQT